MQLEQDSQVPGPGSTREQWAFLAAIAGLAALFVVQACQSTTLLDDWYQLGWLEDHGLDLALIAWLSPLQGEDWQHWLWSADHHLGGHGGWLAGHLGFARACGYLLARSTLCHAIASPLIGLVLLAGVFTLAARRLPDPGRWSDVLGIALISAMIWIALPRAGAMWFHRPYVAAQIYGGALVVWFAVPFRCRLRIQGPAWAAAMFACCGP